MSRCLTRREWRYHESRRVVKTIQRLMTRTRTSVSRLLCDVERKIGWIVDFVGHRRGTCVRRVRREESGVVLATSNRGYSTNLPSSGHCVHKCVHPVPISFASAKWQLVGVADGSAVAKIGVDIASLSIRKIGNLGVTRVGALETADVVRPGVGSKQSESVGEALVQLSFKTIKANGEVGVVNWIDYAEEG